MPGVPDRHPLSDRAFRSAWLAGLLTALAAWTHESIAGWWVASLTGDPLSVGLVQACLTIPVFLFALPCGLLADRADRRSLLLAAQLGALAVAVLLAAATWADRLTLESLVGLSLVLGCCTALRLPAHSSLLPDLVSRAMLGRAVALNGLALHGARMLGPALAGGASLLAGTSTIFALNAAMLAVATVVLRVGLPADDRAVRPRVQPALLSELLAGPRFAIASPAFRRLAALGVGLFFSAACPVALLPLLAGPRPHDYAMLLAFAGAGAVAGLGAFRGASVRRPLDGQLAAGFLALAAGCLLLVWDEPASRALAALAHGWGWMVALTSVQFAAQSTLPDWIRARGLSVIHMLFMGAAAIGSVAWGWFASWAGPDVALMAVASGLIALAVAGRPRQQP